MAQNMTLANVAIELVAYYWPNCLSSLRFIDSIAVRIDTALFQEV